VEVAALAVAVKVLLEQQILAGVVGEEIMELPLMLAHLEALELSSFVTLNHNKHPLLQQEALR
jgi:hypothetical protein